MHFETYPISKKEEEIARFLKRFNGVGFFLFNTIQFFLDSRHSQNYEFYTVNPGLYYLM